MNAAVTPLPPLRRFGWLLRREDRALADRSLSGLAAPARLALLTLLGGAALAAAFWLFSQVSA